MSWVFDHSESVLAERLVLLAIANHTSIDGSNAFPAYPLIASEAHCSEKTVQRAIRNLVKMGELQVDKPHGRHTSKTYSLPKFQKLVSGQIVHPKNAIVGGHPGIVSGQIRPRNKEEPSFKNHPDLKASRPAGALGKWLSIKSELERILPSADYKLWVRPMYLLRVMSGQVLLLTLPPSHAVVEAAGKQQELLHAEVLKAGFNGFVLGKYPDDYERDRLKAEYPEFWSQMYGKGEA